jgi:hypothetical protein
MNLTAAPPITMSTKRRLAVERLLDTLDELDEHEQTVAAAEDALRYAKNRRSEAHGRVERARARCVELGVVEAAR